jgi:cell wall-associated NlpC family hydrolase
VKQQRVSSGQAVDDPNSYGEWVADVENPAGAYRGRYQLRLDEARGLLKAGAGSSGSGSGDGVVEQVDAVAGNGNSAAGPRALAVVATARKELGVPYRWGGSSPQTGFDCSGLTQWAYAKAGIQIPRTSEQQILASNGHPVDRKHLIPGDLVFFRDSGGDVHHVGISLGGDKFLAAPHTGDVVKVSSLDEPYYAQQFAGGRRFDMSGGRDAQWVAASAGAAQGSAPAVDPGAVRDAEAALARDAAEVQRPGSLLFEAVTAQELGKQTYLGVR